MAQPDDRKVHNRVTPEAGGVALFVAMLVAWAVAASIPALSPLFRGSSEPLGLILGAAAIFVVGIIDDFRDMSAPAKVAGEVLAATILYFMGVTWFQFKVPLAGLVQLSPEWTPLLTALWVIAITNAVNLIDGLDGLATGVVAIASGALAVYGLHLQHLGTLPTDNIGPLIAVITCGICLGFLPHNFHPAKIFMGDAGALLLGLLMAASTMLIGGRAVTSGAVNGVAAHTGQTYFFFAPCSSRSSSSVFPWWTWRSPSCAAPPIAPGSPPRTRTTSIIDCSAWVTVIAARCSSCGPGRSCFRGSSSFRCTSRASTPSSPSAPSPSGSCSTPCSTPPSAGRANRDRRPSRGRRAEAATPGDPVDLDGSPERAVRRNRSRPASPGWIPRPAIGHHPAAPPDLLVFRPAPPDLAVKCERRVAHVLPGWVRRCDDPPVNFRPLAPSEGFLPMGGAMGSGRTTT